MCCQVTFHPQKRLPLLSVHGSSVELCPDWTSSSGPDFQRWAHLPPPPPPPAAGWASAQRWMVRAIRWTTPRPDTTETRGVRRGHEATGGVGGLKNWWGCRRSRGGTEKGGCCWGLERRSDQDMPALRFGVVFYDAWRWAISLEEIPVERSQR